MTGDTPLRKGISQPMLYLLSILIGVVAGFGAVVFRGLIAFFHNLMFLGTFSFSYDANTHTPASPWGLAVVLVPVIGAFGVAYLVKNFAPEAKGHGVPEVMDAIYYNKGVIRPIVAAIKSIASALSIGSGGSIGREGPIIQIGASFGSTMGQILPLSVWQRVTLIAAGAGGGIAATFNTPVGGVLFAVEIMMAEVSVRTLVPVAISTATATYIGRIIFGDTPSFIIPKLQTHYFHLTQPEILLAYVGLGLIAGVVSALYIKSIYGFEDLFEKKIKGSYYFRHMTGMLLVGIIMTVMMLTLGHYYTEGVGYATIQDILSSHSPVIWILLLLFALKLLAVSLTLGSGASGGIFSPGLFMGATLGGAYGIVLDKLFPGGAFHPAAFAVAGMAGLIGGSTGAALTAIVMIFEMTLDYNVIIPMTITVALSYGVSRLLSRETIYTLKLVRRGHYMPEALQTNFHHLQRVKDICEREFGTVDADTSLTEFSDITADHPDFSFYLVRDKDTLIGIASRHVPLDYVGRPHQSHLVRDIMMTDFVSAGENERLFELMVKMRLQKVSMGVVTSDGIITSVNDVKGLITQRQIARALEEAVELFSE